jgi:GNAT superfamily N-acetyltransferase
MPKIFGQHEEYRWIEARDLTLHDLLSAVPEFVLGERFAITSFDSGPFCPNREEVAAGWERIGFIAATTSYAWQHDLSVPSPRNSEMIRIIEESASAIEQYAYVPSRFEVREVLVLPVPNPTLTGLPLELCAVDPPYVKDYDLLPGNHPTQWGERFDLRCWGFLTAWVEGQRMGGAVIAWDTPGLVMLEERRDLAVLWDLRVAPAAWRRGIGSALFLAAEEWAVARGASQMKVETQNINGPACRFYARQGCTLGAIHRFAYPELPHEIQLLWYKDLPRSHHRTKPGAGAPPSNEW